MAVPRTLEVRGFPPLWRIPPGTVSATVARNVNQLDEIVQEAGDVLGRDAVDRVTPESSLADVQPV